MMDDLTAFQRDALYVIAGIEDNARPHGLSIKDELEQHYEVRSITGGCTPISTNWWKWDWSRRGRSTSVQIPIRLLTAVAGKSRLVANGKLSTPTSKHRVSATPPEFLIHGAT